MTEIPVAAEALREHADLLAGLVDALLLSGPCDPCYEDHGWQDECECSCHARDREVTREAHRVVVAYRVLVGRDAA